MNTSLTKTLGLYGGSVAAFVGCGGKTSLINLIAEEMKDKRVLVSPTTHMFPLACADIVVDTLENCCDHEPRAGVQCLGVKEKHTGKLTGLPTRILRALIPEYDIVLLEADGSRGLPLKGYKEFEPSIPPFCTHTIGIVTLCSIGKPVNEKRVHRLEQFTALTGLNEGDDVTPEAIERMCSPAGMFKGSSGKRCLLVNQVEDEKGEKRAQKWLGALSEHQPGRFSSLLYGSVAVNSWHTL